MNSSILQLSDLSTETLTVEFFKQSEGKWNSQRRYYTLASPEEPEEIVSSISVRFLELGSTELVKLAELHELDSHTILKGGSEVTWESSYTGQIRKPSKGKTVIGVAGNILYRDRGFATSKPVTAVLFFPNPKTMCLKTEYGGATFEEEIKLIGQNYRTRQTIISRAGQEHTIGQYLEKRIA